MNQGGEVLGMKLTSADVRIGDEGLTVDGRQLSELLDRAGAEPAVQRQLQITRGLPVEDQVAGHVAPAVILTTSRSC